MDAIDSVVDPLRDFAKDSIRLVKRCHKPDRKGIYSSSYPTDSTRSVNGFYILARNSCLLDSYCERSVSFLPSDQLDLYELFEDGKICV